ncbi:KTSC domain-containing protein [bacterium]|nr:KTSC domain-containing protein [bacterium]
MITTTHSHYDSSTLKSAAYNYKQKTLTVHFNHASYVYKDVEASNWNLFNLAESQGKALNEFIKPNYEFEKINEELTTLT